MPGVFDPSAFGRDVITRWTRVPADQRLAFDALADEVVGGQVRNRAAAMICTPGGTVESVAAHGDELVFIDLRRPEIDDCTQLMFRRDPARAGAWRYDGEWYCGVDIFAEEWQRELGGGDFATAMTRLRAIRATSPR